MAFHWCDNLHTTAFTPRDYQVELLASAFEQNTMVCLGHKSSKEFVALKLLQELAREPREQKKCSIYLTSEPINLSCSMYTMIQHMTDLKVFLQPAIVEDDFKIWLLDLDYDVYILDPYVCLRSLKQGAFKLCEVNLIVLEDCHEANVYEDVLPIFKEFYQPLLGEMPKVLGLAGPLHSASCALQELGAMLNALEDNVHCTTETASDVVTVLRYCAKPVEFIIQCAPLEKDDLTLVLEDIICSRKAFLTDHRYDPFEIYNTDEFLDELKDIPDPKKEPLEFLDIILAVLHEMGPWCADRVALNMYHRIETQKIKTPHERHYILLCLVNTALFEIRAICEQTFRKLSNHKEIVERYSSPKILRLLEILRLFKPEEFVSENEMIQKLSHDLEKLDFRKITRTVELSCQSVENITARQQLESRSIIENLDAILKPNHEQKSEINKLTANAQTKTLLGSEKLALGINTKSNKFLTTPKRGSSSTFSGRTNRRLYSFAKRQTRGNMFGDSDGLDTLCGIIFCGSNYTARVLFDLLAEMSRHDPDLKFLKCQFTTDRVADPLHEPKEAELEHRRQEEVLKRFRMHDSNVLIGTSILEEGIDLPKCNLVVRWDAPTTYRSYVQCKGKARAAPAYHITLVAPKFDTENGFICMREQVTDRTHKFLCRLEENQDVAIESDSNEDEPNENKMLSKCMSSSKGIVKILNPEVITHKPPTCTDDKRFREIKGNLLPVEGTTPYVSNGLSLTEIEDETIDSNGIMENNSSTREKSLSPQFCRDKSIFDCTIEIVDVNTAIANLGDTMNSNHSSEDCQRICHLNDTKNVSHNSLKHIKTYNFLESKNNHQIDTDKVKYSNEKIFQCSLKNSFPGYRDDSFEVKMHQMDVTTSEIVEQLAQYRQIEEMLLQKCANFEPPESEHLLADKYTHCVEAYKPQLNLLTGASVDLSTSISLVNKYCSKLPSDTFTKLTALWRCSKTIRNGNIMFQYTLRLPINSPLKHDIVGLPMPTNILARRMAALQACIELHKCGELDNNLQPIGKEGFRAIEEDWENFELEEEDEKIVSENLEPRPGTTKRRQFYYKRIASEFCNCRPTSNVPCFLYLIDLTLQCPIPEEQNTRGRKIYPPEDAVQGFGILTLKRIPKVSAFPIFTRSGEVKVSIKLAKEQVVLTENQVNSINTFVSYTFTNVLRLQKFLMLFDVDSTENCIFIVPTLKTKEGKNIDWEFLKIIERNAAMMPTVVPEEKRKSLEFDANKFKDAVVMPWYRNQDQPQYFYVAEICSHLSPLSCFPGENYNTFKHYYFVKYGLVIQNVKQPLLDVDHTSARLNFLTPRYVNRKGVALPTSSEETKRAKRENLEQKQILVPELCTVHPFPASLWRTAVCLPCILYRINGLLLADDIRKKVSKQILGNQYSFSKNFEWPMLDFGWSFSEVLKKSRENQNLQQDASEISGKNLGAIQKSELNEEKIHTRDKSDISGGDNLATDVKNNTEKKSANEICMEGEKKLQGHFVEIGTWSNEMANNIEANKDINLSDDEDEELMKYLPSNVSFCNQQTRYGSPTFWDIKDSNIGQELNSFSKNAATTSPMKIKKQYIQRRNRNTNPNKQIFSYYESDDSLSSSYDSFVEDDESEEALVGPFHIAFTSKNEAESYETAEEIQQRQKQLAIIQATTVNERNYQKTKNLQVGYNFIKFKGEMQAQLKISVTQFMASTKLIKENITRSGMLISYDQSLILPRKELKTGALQDNTSLGASLEAIQKCLPYVCKSDLALLLKAKANSLTVMDMESLNLEYARAHKNEIFTIVGCGDLFDNFNDKMNLTIENKKESNRNITKRIKLNFEPIKHSNNLSSPCTAPIHQINEKPKVFSFDYQPDLFNHPGPSPSIILQALTMSNANDGINLERLETIGDSFLKYAITTYLYITYENVHEGKLSHLRSKQVANLNLYRLGRRKKLGEYMIATKFEPHDNWLPPCYYVPKELEKALIEAKIPPPHWKLADLPNIKKLNSAEICKLVQSKAEKLGLSNEDYICGEKETSKIDINFDGGVENNDFACFIPYNLVTQHSIPDKSIADCVEALIGAYLIECGPRGALLFMAWIGIRVLPFMRVPYNPEHPRLPGSTEPDQNNMIKVFKEWIPPKSPLLPYAPNAKAELEKMLHGFDVFEATLGYKFRDRSYLLQAMTHASYSPNRLTDCYQRLEFLGDAVLDYLITRHLYEDPWQHSPGALTDLRSALVNNTIFASLAVRHGFHKYFRHLSPGLNEVIDRFVRIQNENGHSISEEYYLLSEEECDDAEDVEVPKALGDVFESVAGAIFLDSGMSLDAVWKVYSNMMKPEIEQFSSSVPKSPIRELLELEPETAKFGKPEKLADGRRVRVSVDVFCKGTFRGIGRNYRIAKCTAAKCALRQLKKQGLISKKD